MKTLKKIYWRFKWLKSIRLGMYFYLNYFSSHVVRNGDVKIIPYKGAVINLGKGSRLELNGRNLEIGINRLNGSKNETLIRLETGARWNCNNGASLCYGSTLEIKENAEVTSGYFFMNVGSVIVCAKKVQIGDDVWLGRGIIIYDSDFHQLLDGENKIRNYPQAVVIGDHVWLTNQIMVQKGVHIGNGSVISPFTLVRKDVPEHSLIVSGSSANNINSEIRWSSKSL